jgi:hypothetical protein
VTSRLLAATGVATCALAGCTGGGGEVHPQGNMTLDEARRFATFPLYYPGDAVGGIKLEAIIRSPFTSPRPHTRVTFLYGTCETRGEGGCTPPLYVLLWNECFRFEQRYSIPLRERVTVRGVPGRFRRPSKGTSARLELYPAGVTVVLNDYSAGKAGSLLQVAGRLRGLNVSAAPSMDLPDRPPRPARVGRCERKP